jgi:hypothetical protein
MVIIDKQCRHGRCVRRRTMALIGVPWVVFVSMGGLMLLLLLGWVWTVRTLSGAVRP